MSTESERPEDEAPEAETPAASETSGESPAASAAAEPTPGEESTTAPAGDPVAEEAAPKAKAKAKPKAKAKAKPKAQPAAKTEPTAEEAAAETPAAPAKPKPAPRRRDLPREPAEAVVVRAQAKYVRSSARKARLVCDNIRGKTVADAKSILAFHPRNVAEAWEKLLDSAVANAENNHDLDVADLRITAVFADEGPTLKRFRPRAMGRATRIRKRTSHLTIHLTPKEG